MNRFESVTAGTASHSTWLPNDGNQVAGYKPLRWLTALLLVAFVAGCGNGGGGRDPILGGSASVLQGLVSIKVTPVGASIPVSGTQQYTATGTYNDGSSKDVTASSTWTVVNVPVGVATLAKIGAAEVATGHVIGTSTITAALGGALGVKSNSAILTVSNATSKSFVVKPTTATIPLTGNQKFTATETFSDGTSFDRTALSTWNAVDLVPVVLVNVPVASITNPVAGVGGGVATGLNAGTSTITASYGVYQVGYAGVPGSSDTIASVLANRTAILTVSNAIVMSIQVTPALASIVKGSNQNYLATALLSDGTTNDVTANSLTTWSAADVTGTNVATLVGVSGGFEVVTGSNLGSSDITATFSGKSNVPAARLNVIAGSLGPGPAGAVDLKSVAPYGIIAYDAITNSANPSHIYGDVALTEPTITYVAASGPTTGFFDGPLALPAKTSSIVTNSNGVSPGLVDTPDNGNSASLPQLLADLKNAYTDLSTRPVTGGGLTVPLVPPSPLPTGGTFASGTDLSGWVLGPGIYSQSGAYGLSATNGPLVLDAGGNADAVFIIQSSAPTGLTSTSGSVVLRNGAQSKNVYWVAPNVTIGGSTFFQGTVVAGHVIVLGTFANVEGRMLAGALGLVSGALTLSGANVITVPK